MQKTILAFGETLWDLMPSGATLGGAPFNFAYRATSLGDRGVIVTRLGSDERGQKAIEQIATLGMETAYVQRDDVRPTGTVRVWLNDRGSPDFHIVPDAAYDFIDLNYELMELAGAADCFSFGTLAQRTEKSRLTLRRAMDLSSRAIKFLDLNLRKDCYSPEIITDSLQCADILKINLTEAEYLAKLFGIPVSPLPDFCAGLIAKWNLKCCVVTLDEHGAFAADANGDNAYVPGYVVKLVDTCGCGDAFSAGFVHEYLRHKPLLDCCRLGNALGAMVAQQTGATTPISTSAIYHFLQASHRMNPEPMLRHLAKA